MRNHVGKPKHLDILSKIDITLLLVLFGAINKIYVTVDFKRQGSILL